MIYTYSLKTHNREEMIDITSYIQQSVENSKIEEGILIVYVPHTTAAVTINENADPSVRKDITDFLRNKIPKSTEYSHLEGNADSHIKSTLVGPTLSLIIENGKLLLGTWQGIYFCEFDGPRNRNFIVKIIEG
ncbi:protein of unknown function UPF0047 [Petrotoga mobilis SJ95]|jgi:secondary thiamine-phosphate synthase enzyme|uniref:Secondary thiamine-phosphate synthase enzyme n=3 Tax=Petrotoga TaxID=28236 RepID=A9BJ61_PETMO|nr:MULTISPECIES: secondary thiamine-phosphate synthase enzyme YjbQ [Petrotoga]ABX31006.1 protein of unknown function UPF0047 [Petrotoga mobilis SJ95]MBL5981109.1 hypothetical protein [Petrotoga sp. 8T1HF07.NaAc.6.1]PNR89450.1 hypothetical protein X925_02565 [Petrotoga sp. 9T1HF07.CasAA.8.2]PNR93055.1 hypothetical protein X926_04495 [Petrotoga sp. HWHPT.55.6.3]PNR95109.1 hypothetical protein X929_09765 [Petrotoga olearia DSM 13574]